MRHTFRNTRPHFRVHTLDSLHHRNFRFLWVSTLCVTGGFFVYRVVVGWLTYDLTGSPLLTALSQGLDNLPFLVIGPMAGVVVDTWDRRRIVASVAVYQAAVTAVFAAVMIFGTVESWHIIVYVLAMGVSWAITDPAKLSILPNIVPKHSLINAMALNSMASSASRLVLPALAGVLIAVIGGGHTLALGVALFLGASLTALTLDLGKAERQRTAAMPRFAELADAARYLKGEPSVLALMVLRVIPAVLVAPFVAGLMPVYASEVFGTGSAGLGLLISALGVGALVGTLTLATKGEIRLKGRALFLGLVIAVGAMIAFSLVRTMVLALPVLVLFNASLLVFGVTSNATIQSLVPDELRGRVASLGMIRAGLTPLGCLLAGGIAEVLDAPTATLIAGFAVSALLVVTMLRFRHIWTSRYTT